MVAPLFFQLPNLKLSDLKFLDLRSSAFICGEIVFGFELYGKNPLPLGH
jgi:hypothetical protein